jgi:glycerol-3-phosphate dehydrogenase (NAD+)
MAAALNNHFLRRRILIQGHNHFLRHLTTTSGEQVCVLGSGSFGSAITRVLSQSPSTKHVNLHARRSEIVEEINLYRTNRQYIDEAAGEIFPSKVTASSSLSDSITGATVLVLVVPSNYLKPLLVDIQINRHLLGDNPFVVSLVKSLHYDGRRGRLTTICDEITHHLDDFTIPVVALMGPNIYTEMIRDTFAEATIGHLQKDLDAAARAQQIFTTDTFRTSTCDDRIGVELAGGLKNVVSLGAGFCEGLGHGANARAAIIRLGLREMVCGFVWTVVVNHHDTVPSVYLLTLVILYFIITRLVLRSEWERGEKRCTRRAAEWVI